MAQDMVSDTTAEAPIRWGILATGGIAAQFTSQVREMAGAEVVAVGSRTLESAKKFAERFEIPRAYGSWAELAEDDGVDVVYIATPHNAHHAAAKLCLEAGKAVLCEKAFTINTREAEELVELARAKGLFLMEGMWTYTNPIVRRMMELVREGAIGEVRMIQADFGFAGKFDPANRMRNPELGGGALLDLGVYPVSFAHLLLGEPSEIQARAHLTPEGTDAETGMLLGWESGATALLSCSITASLPITAVVSGTKGRIEFPRGFFAPLKCVLHVDGEDPVEITEPEPKGMRDEAAEVMRALRAGELESPLVPLEGSLAVMRTLDRVRELIGVRYPGEV